MDMDVDELELLSLQQQILEEEELLQDLEAESLSPPHARPCNAKEIEGISDGGICGKRHLQLTESKAEEANGGKRRMVTSPEKLRFTERIGVQDDSVDKEKQEKGETVDANLPRRLASEIEGHFIPITGPTGERVYSKIREFQAMSIASNLCRASKGLLSAPMNVLLERVEQESFEKACHASVETETEECNTSHEIVNEQLWVDKYAPKSFTELLSDEKTNREVLQWLKQWDLCVFGSRNTVTSSGVLSALRRHSSHSDSQKLYNNKSLPIKNKNGVTENNANGTSLKMDNLTFKNENENFQSNLLQKKRESDGRPDEKILLLCGAPGLGKTTLAHVTARHCGYNVVEINASDDRSEAVMESKILDVVQMNSISCNSQPKCLIIDEIDGALADGKGAVEVLLRMISSEKASTDNVNTGSTESTNSSKKKGAKKAGRLLRPVICICNDISASSLRTLRQVARVHVFVQPSTSRVVNRLKYICNKEGFKTSAQCLTALAEFTGCDIRACLNTLQFLHNKNEVLNVIDIGSQVIGRKDSTGSIFDIWKEVLHKSKSKGNTLKAVGQVDSCFTQLHDKLLNHGDFELLVEGIHENFLNTKYHDSAMDKTVNCLENLCSSDVLSRYIFQSQKFDFNVYQSSFAGSVRHLIAQIQKPIIEWPKAHHSYRQTLASKKDLVNSWLDSISPVISKYLSVHSIVEDMVSFLLCILSPPTLKPVASQLSTGKERKEIIEIVDIMVDYAVTYRKGSVLPPYMGGPMKHASLNSEFFLSPPINDLVTFKDYSPSHCLLASAMQQILGHEVEKQKIIRESLARTARANEVAVLFQETSLSEEVKTTDAFSEANPNSLKNDTNIENSAPSMSNQSRLRSIKDTISGSKPCESGISNLKIVEKKTQSSINYFERFKRGSQRKAAAEENSTNVAKSTNLGKLLFRFNEGFTNAVKRYVRFGELEL